MPIQLNNFGSNEFETVIHSGFVSVHSALDSDSVRSLRPGIVSSRLWIPYGADQFASDGWEQSLFRCHPTLITRLFLPRLYSLMAVTKARVQSLAREGGYTDLYDWGNFREVQRGGVTVHRSLGLRYYSLSENGWIASHVDPESQIGMQFGFVLSGRRRYEATTDQGEVVPMSIGVGGAFVQRETVKINDVLMSGPNHKALDHEDACPGVVGIVSYVERVPEKLVIRFRRLGERTLSATGLERVLTESLPFIGSKADS